jgi:hypothetical protein
MRRSKKEKNEEEFSIKEQRKMEKVHLLLQSNYQLKALG